MSKGFASNFRMTLLAAGVLACFVGVGVRLVFLHILDRDDLLKYINKARRQIVVEHARRGAILDTKGDLLAASRSFVTVGIDPEMMHPADEKQWSELARMLQRSPNELAGELRTAMNTGRQAMINSLSLPGEKRVRWVKLADEIDEDVYDQITKLKVRGLYGARGYKRVYPGGELAAHVLGYVNKEGVAVTGTERHLDIYLKGEDGWIESEKDGARRELAQFRSRDVPVHDGNDVVLTIDSVIQHMIETELKTIASTFHPNFATIIVSEPQTGRILGMANYPSYDLNFFEKAPLNSQRNNAVTDVIEPGSVFKIVAAGGALDMGLVTTASTFNCGETSIFYKNRQLKLPKEDEPFEQLSVAEIVSHSSNRGAAQLAMLMGDDNFYGYVRKYGFGESTKYQLGGEVRGILEEPKNWDSLTITRMPMGHSIAATPLQVHMAMSAVANGGLLLRPQILKEIRDAQGNIVRSFAPERRGQVLKPSTAAVLAQLLHRVVTEGTAKGFDVPGFELAGKTGTTQKIIDGKYSTTHHVGSFVGFFPASRPEIVLSVIVDDAKVARGAYGRVVAAPSFKRLAEQLIQYRDITPVVIPTPTAALAFNGGVQ